jgi:hypothetical protein
MTLVLFITNKSPDCIKYIPLPPYIERTDDEQDLSRYQTVYAKHDGAVAAPTAGLHFDDALLNSLNGNNASAIGFGLVDSIHIILRNLIILTVHSMVFDIVK